MDGDYRIAQGAVAHDFWATIFSMHDFFSSLPKCANLFLLHIFFAVTFLVARGGQPPGARTCGLQPHCSQGYEGRSFLCSHSGKQYVLQGSPWPEKEQEAGFFKILLD
jgi:hypothetical protein